MKKRNVLPLAALVLAGACADGVTAPGDLNIGVAQPKTEINGAVEIVAGGTGYVLAPGVTTGNCNPVNGQWSADPTSPKIRPHPNCILSEGGGAQIVATFHFLANYVQPKSGNIHLNFSACGYTEVYNEDDDAWEPVLNPCLVPAYIHHHHKHMVLSAAGILSAANEGGDAWTIDLGGNLNGTPGPGGFADKAFILDAVGPGGAPGTAVLSWE